MEIFTDTLVTNTLKLYLLSSFQFLKCAVIGIFVVGVIPFLLGLIFELVVVSPLRVGMNQSPLYFPAQVWYD